MTVENKPVIDRTGKQSNLNIALLEGDKGDAMLAVFDGGATRTAIRRELTDNGNIEVLDWGTDTTTQGVGNIQVTSQLAKIVVPAPETAKVKGYTIWAVVQSIIILTQDKYLPQILLDYTVDKLQGISGYERVGTDNFQPRLGGNVDMWIGNDLLELHPTDITWIYDGFKVVHHRARLHNPNHFLGFV